MSEDERGVGTTLEAGADSRRARTCVERSAGDRGRRDFIDCRGLAPSWQRRAARVGQDAVHCTDAERVIGEACSCRYYYGTEQGAR